MQSLYLLHIRLCDAVAVGLRVLVLGEGRIEVNLTAGLKLVGAVIDRPRTHIRIEVGRLSRVEQTEQKSDQSRCPVSDEGGEERKQKQDRIWGINRPRKCNSRAPKLDSTKTNDNP